MSSSTERKILSISYGGNGNCPHEWVEVPDSQFSSEKFTDVKCQLCGMPGELIIETGGVFFPTT